MLPTTADNGARLAAVLPTAIAAIALGQGRSREEVAEVVLGSHPVPEQLPAVRSLVVVLVDGLGMSNLKARAGHARTLAGLQMKRIETVVPSTTAAALTTLTTGQLPGTHGLIGYKIRHPELGLITTLKEWQGITRPREWQRCTPLFGVATGLGMRAIAVGRPAHAEGGLTASILAGAEYLGGQTIDDRVTLVSQALQAGDPLLAYLYVDELDRVAHSDGWQSAKWMQRLEQLDAAIARLLRSLPADAGLLLTADHGIVDVLTEHQIVLDDGTHDLRDVAEIGGEPRLRSLYLSPNADVQGVADRLSASLGRLAWVGTRASAIAAGWFGEMHPLVEDRLGDVLIAARGQHAFVLQGDAPEALAMVGQHGGLSDDERGVPLALGGALTGTGTVSALTAIARSRLAD